MNKPFSLSILLICIFQTSCKNHNLVKQTRYHLDKHNFNKSFKLTYSIERFQAFSPDTFTFDITVFRKHMNDSQSVYIMETTKTTKRYSNGKSKPIISEVIDSNSIYFTLFENQIVYSCKVGVGNSTEFMTEKQYTGNRFCNFPFWLDLSNTNENALKNFYYERENDLWTDSLKNFSVRYKNNMPNFAKNNLVGTMGFLTNEFHLKSYTPLSEIEFDSIFGIYRNYLENTTTIKPHSIDDDTISLTKMPVIKAFHVDTKKDFSIQPDDSFLTLVDFSYARCAPCVQLIPVLDSLSQRYKKHVKYYILDPMDKLPRDSALLVYFVKTYGLKETLYLTDISSTYKNNFNVHGYPSIFLFSPDGKVLFKQTGLRDDIFQVLDEVIKNNIPIR